MTPAERTTKITRAFEWLQDSNNHGTIVELYGSNAPFKSILDGLLNDGTQPTFLGMLDIFQSCVGGVQNKMFRKKLDDFRKKNHMELSDDEKSYLVLLDVVLESQQMYGESGSDSSPSRSSSSAETPSSKNYDADVEDARR
jgi:hypothetical protein